MANYSLFYGGFDGQNRFSKKKISPKSAGFESKGPYCDWFNRRTQIWLQNEAQPRGERKLFRVSLVQQGAPYPDTPLSRQMPLIPTLFWKGVVQISGQRKCPLSRQNPFIPTLFQGIYFCPSPGNFFLRICFGIINFQNVNCYFIL